MKRKREIEGNELDERKKFKSTYTLESMKSYLNENLLMKSDVESNRFSTIRKLNFNFLNKSNFNCKNKYIISKIIKEYLIYLLTKTLENEDSITIENLTKTLQDKKDYFLQD